VKFAAICAGLEKNGGERQRCEEHFHAYKACKEQDVRCKSANQPTQPARTHIAGDGWGGA
jgi:hypothetical protein